MRFEKWGGGVGGGGGGRGDFWGGETSASKEAELEELQSIEVCITSCGGGKGCFLPPREEIGALSGVREEAW